MTALITHTKETITMATPIKSIPQLEGEVAENFVLKAAEESRKARIRESGPKILQKLKDTPNECVSAIWIAKVMMDFELERWRYVSYLESNDYEVSFSEFAYTFISDYSDVVNQNFNNIDIDILSIWEYAVELEKATDYIVDEHQQRYWYGFKF